MSAGAPALAGRLAALLGDAHVLAAPDDCRRYAVHGVAPACVALPGTLEQLAATLEAAHAHGAAVLPWGGGTRQRIGAPAPRAELVVVTARLDRVLLHEPDDLTISVEAGLTLGALQAHLARHGQMLPVDPPLPARATIGGLLATAADGPRRLGYGTLRDLLIGVTVVEAGGRVSRGGGMVVKNVSGFDMMKLYTGSFGTLALIARANFKLLPLPRADASLLCTFGAPAAAFAFLGALQQTRLTPTAAEYLNGGALAELGLAGGCAVALRAEGLPAAVERHLRDMAALAERHRASAAEPIAEARHAALWAQIADLAQAERLAEGEALLKLAALPSETEQAVALAESIGRPALISARALSGVVYARLRNAAPTALASLADAPALQWLASDLPGAPRWGAVGGAELMRRLKQEFDPSATLNPGRFVAGI